MVTGKSLSFSRIFVSTINFRLLYRYENRISVWLTVTNILVLKESFCDLQVIIQIQVWVTWCYIFISCGNPCNISCDGFFDTNLWFSTDWISMFGHQKIHWFLESWQSFKPTHLNHLIELPKFLMLQWKTWPLETWILFFIFFWLVVSTHLKNISQIGSFPQVGVKIKNIWNHHLVFYPTIDLPTIVSTISFVTFTWNFESGRKVSEIPLCVICHPCVLFNEYGYPVVC